MLRVNAQQQLLKRNEEAFFTHGAGKKHETFGEWMKRTGRDVEVITPDRANTTVNRENTIKSVQARLGRLYKPPVKA